MVLDSAVTIRLCDHELTTSLLWALSSSLHHSSESWTIIHSRRSFSILILWISLPKESPSLRPLPADVGAREGSREEEKEKGSRKVLHFNSCWVHTSLVTHSWRQRWALLKTSPGSVGEPRSRSILPACSMQPVSFLTLKASPWCSILLHTAKSNQHFRV